MNPDSLDDPQASGDEWDVDEALAVTLPEALTWLGEAKMRLLAVAGACALLGLGLALALPAKFTATTTFLPPVSAQQQAGSAAALAALGSLSGLAGSGMKTPDEMYVALLTGDSVVRGLNARFNLRERYEVTSHEALRRRLAEFVRVGADKKSGLISVDVEDRDPEFATRLTNAHAEETSKMLGRLAIGEAQQRRAFYERQIKGAKESLVQAEAGLRAVQEKSGMIALERAGRVGCGGRGPVAYCPWAYPWPSYQPRPSSMSAHVVS